MRAAAWILAGWLTGSAFLSNSVQMHLASLIGSFAPVMAPAEVTYLGPASPPPARTLWEVRSDKLRDCSPLMLEWSYIDEDGHVVPVAYMSDQPIERRDLGPNEWRFALRLNSPQVGQIITRGRVIATHSCRTLGLSYKVRTVWYEGDALR